MVNCKHTALTEHSYLHPLIPHAGMPSRLYVAGTLPQARQPTVAIVGSRRPTPYGKEVTHQLAFDLASRGIVVVSGLAYGVDAIAHQAALEAGGPTIAILGSGLDVIYPASHKALARRIINSGGALISEYSPEVRARGYQFLARNRLVSAVSDAVIVTEATLRSGTLSTVNHALEQGIEVFAVPGNITSPLSVGTNALIRQGATLVTSVNDILERVAPDTIALPQVILGDTDQEVTIITLLQQGIRDGDELCERSILDIQLFNQTMTLLEIKGIIRPLGANQWGLTKSSK